MSSTLPLVWIDGHETSSASVSVFDWGLQRGDGCFEVLRSYDGHGFAAQEHVDRLVWSARQLEISLPPISQLLEWVRVAAERGVDCMVRIIVTRGSPTYGQASRVLIMAEPVHAGPAELRLMPVEAPWHSAGRKWKLAGVKSLSYGPNMAASRQAKAAGFDDAILVSDSNIVLEGPTFTVGWVADGVVETPGLDLLILDSITRRHVLAAARSVGVEIVEGVFHLDRMLAADEVFAMSTNKEVMPVVGVSNVEYPNGELAARLATVFDVSSTDPAT